MQILSVGPPALDSSGYGEMQRRILLALGGLGWTIALRPFPSLNAMIQDEHNKHKLQKMEENPLPPHGFPQLFFAPAPMFMPNPNYYNIGFTMTEVDIITQEWVEKCNRMDEVWVPSRFNYDTFLSCGVQPEKLHIMHLGVDTKHFKPAKNKNTKNKFIFLSSFELIPRKACDLLMEAFCEEFDPLEPIELVIKAYKNGGKYDPKGKALMDLLFSVKEKHKKNPAISFEKELIPYSALPALYQNADCYISASRGEGWNLPLMEAMSCGIPVIALNWSGQTEFLTPQNSFPLEVPGLEEINCPWCPGARWAVIDRNSLRKAMRYAVENPLEAKKKGNQGRDDIAKNYSLKKIAKKIASRLRNINHKLFRKKVAVIGFGNWGKNIVRILLSLNSLDVVICDPGMKTNPFPGDSMVEFDNFSEILNNPQINELFIVTPASTHYSLVREALLAGKNVFVEKPFTMSSEEAKELIALAKTRNLILMVGHIMQYHPAVRYLKELINSGSLGEILYFRSARTNLGSVRTDVGVLWDLAVHDIDLVCLLIKQLPIAVNAWNKVFLKHSQGDITTLQLTFPSGVIAHLSTSWLDPLKKRELVVVGNKKMAVFDDTSPSQKLAVIERGVEYIEAPYFENFGDFQFHYRYGDILYPYIDLQEPLRNEIIHFLDCVEDLCQPLTSGEEALSVIKILEAADLSAQNSGKTISLDWSPKEED